MSANTLYLECYSGISGDMTVAALLDLGADEEVLLNGLASLDVDGYTINISKTVKCGIVAKKFDVVLQKVHHHEQEDHQQNDHQQNDHQHANHEHDGHGHIHTHVHEHDHRNLIDIQKIISNSKLTAKSKDIANRIFEVVAYAEAKVHGKRIEEVHFHEVGAIDSIVDIVATAICIDNLNIMDVIISPIYEGTGHVKCQHGVIPVPVPAVMEIVTSHGLRLKITDNTGEMITPTGAAIAAALKTKNSLPENGLFKKIGIGAGTKDFSNANILRAYLIEEDETNSAYLQATAGTISSVNSGDVEEQIIVLECNIDDMTGEELGFALEVLLEEGALDAYFTPIFMKKNRPATMFSVLCQKNDCHRIKALIFKYTTTLGIRMHSCERTTMDRTFHLFQSSLGEVTIKRASYDTLTKQTIEYEDVKRIAKERGLSANEVFKIIYRELH